MNTANTDQKHPALKLVYLLLIIIASVILINTLGMALGIPIFGKDFFSNMSYLNNPDNPENITRIKYVQFINHISLFFIPALAFVLLSKDKPSRYFHLNQPFSVFIFLLGAACLIMGLPIINALVALNSAISFPEALAGLESWFRQAQVQNENLIRAFLNTSTVSGLLLNIFLMAVVPAVGEEMLFRGALQRIFKDWFGNIHVAVVVTGILFGAMHMQFFSLIPMIVLGVFLGYLYHWSNNLWLPVGIHFFNNVMVVVVAWLSQIGILDVDYDTFGSTTNAFIIIVSLVVCIGCIYLIARLSKNKNTITIFPKEE